MNTENDKYLFAFVFIGCPALYGLFRMLPLLVFYLVPFLGSALLIGWIWTEGCHVKHVNYRRVAALMAGTILVLVLTVGFPHPVALGQKGKILLESRFLYDAFNSFSAGLEASINTSWLKYFRPLFGRLLPPLDYEPVLYDLRDLAWALWLGVCVGAPALFLHLGKKEDQERILKLTADYNAKMKEAERDNFELKRDGWNHQTWASETIAARDEEIAKLREVAASIQKDTSLPPPPQSTHEGGNGSNPPAGVFKSDML